MTPASPTPNPRHHYGIRADTVTTLGPTSQCLPYKRRVIRQIGSRVQRIEHCGPGGTVTRWADLGQRQTRGELFTGGSSSVMAMSRHAATGYGPEARDRYHTASPLLAA